MLVTISLTIFCGSQIPDEVTSVLSYSSSVALRPQVSHSDSPRVRPDPETAGKELRVGKLVTGQYLREGDRWHIMMELVDVNQDRVTWRESLDVMVNTPIQMQDSLSKVVREHLLPALG